MQNPPPPPGYPPPPPPQMAGGYQPMVAASPGSYGGFWIRLVAYIIDAILLGIVGAILSVPLGVNYSDPNSLTSGAARTSNGIDLVLSFVYFTLLWSYMGASLGQRLLGMRVVDATTGLALAGPDHLLLRLFHRCDLGRVRCAKAGLDGQDRRHGGRAGVSERKLGSVPPLAQCPP